MSLFEALFWYGVIFLGLKSYRVGPIVTRGVMLFVAVAFCFYASIQEGRAHGLQQCKSPISSGIHYSRCGDFFHGF